jgi:hypothetical protein
MDDYLKVRYLYLPILPLLLSLAGCDGGGGDAGSLDNPNPPGPGNQGLTGYLYTSEVVSNLDGSRYPVIIDLATGKKHRILAPFELKSMFTAPFASADGSTLVMTGTDQTCKETFRVYSECFYLARLGQPLKLLSPLIMPAAAKVSPNGEMLVADGELDSNSTDALRLIALDGGLISNVGDHRIGTYAWLPDGRLMYVWNRTFYLTDRPYSLTATAVYTYSDTLDINSLSSSHDGTRVAFVLAQRENANTRVMVMNIDGSGLRQLTDSPQDDLTDANTGYPVWSPDDKWIMVVNNTTYDPTLYAVRADATEVILDNDQYAPDDAIKVQTDWQSHLYPKSSGDILTAWLPVAPFISAHAKAQTEASTSNDLPQSLIGEWLSGCRERDGDFHRTTLRYTHDGCTTVEQNFSDTACTLPAGVSERNESCQAAETITTDSGLAATQLHLSDSSSQSRTAIVYREGDTLYLGQGSRLDFDQPYTRHQGATAP